MIVRQKIGFYYCQFQLWNIFLEFASQQQQSNFPLSLSALKITQVVRVLEIYLKRFRSLWVKVRVVTGIAARRATATARASATQKLLLLSNTVLSLNSKLLKQQL